MTKTKTVKETKTDETAKAGVRVGNTAISQAELDLVNAKFPASEGYKVATYIDNSGKTPSPMIKIEHAEGNTTIAFTGNNGIVLTNSSSILSIFDVPFKMVVGLCDPKEEDVDADDMIVYSLEPDEELQKLRDGGYQDDQDDEDDQDDQEDDKDE